MKEYGADDFTAELFGRRAPCPPLLIYFHHEYVEERDMYVVMVRLIRADGTEVLGMCTREEADIATLLHPKAAQWTTRLVKNPLRGRAKIPSEVAKAFFN